MKQFIAIAALFIIAFFAAPSVFAAANLKLDPATAAGTVGGTVDMKVIINTGTDSVSGADIYVLYDSNVVDAQTVTDGDFFPIVQDSITAGRVYIGGLAESSANAKSGTGTVATITFRPKAAGNSQLQFDCRTGASDTSKVIKNDFNQTNILDCATTTGSVLSISTSSTSPTPTSGATISTTPTQLPTTGVVENSLMLIVPGGLLVLIGGLLRLRIHG